MSNYGRVKYLMVQLESLQGRLPNKNLKLVASDLIDYFEERPLTEYEADMAEALVMTALEEEG